MRQKKENDKLLIYIDGASFGNPGHSGIGFVFCDENKNIIKKYYKYIGETTNNSAEYMSLIFALQKSIYFQIKNIEVFSDSELLVRQINKIYRVKHPQLLLLYQICIDLINHFSSFKIHYIEREKNLTADKLAKKAAKLKGKTFEILEDDFN